ncbi:MAG: hypothetical protein JWR77_698 [Rhizorhabdus sp.]|nr:hypothetical protein [Rhizorhabdus sp.]
MFRTVPAQWQTAILVCGKCSKKVGGGFGPKGNKPLVKALRALGNGKKGRKADFGVIETGCLKLCPKNAVVVVDTARPKDWLLVRPGTDAEEVGRQLGLSSSSSSSSC